MRKNPLLYIDPSDLMKLESARGINGHYRRPSIEEYNRAIKKKKLIGVPILVKG